MAVALFIGYKALLRNETPVACIVTKGDEILSIGYNYTNTSLNGTKHAEFIACSRLADDTNFQELTLYVTVEPCIMCASYLRQLHFGKVVFGCGNDRFGGAGTILSVHNDREFANAPFQALDGICRTEAIQLLRNFYIQENESAPSPKVKKNKNIDEKEYPMNPLESSRMEHASFYGKERLIQSGRELTPKANLGYSIANYLDIHRLRKVPYLEKELGDVTLQQLEEFSSLFYDVDKDGQVVYSKQVERYQPKRRKLSES
ncbi:uncharacterized protein LODBEIA_P44570 [Lodderomyces beijingensis]|uniref:CMP/dCMP-type deaminase domain-containing protein n=1 Tax=Lodderomyces beijingensis TaxID=1775926 RepID=A0ABP0ZRB9_9ASCO